MAGLAVENSVRASTVEQLSIFGLTGSPLPSRRMHTPGDFHSQSGPEAFSPEGRSGSRTKDRSPLFRTNMQSELLHPPVADLPYIEFALAAAINGINCAEFL